VICLEHRGEGNDCLLANNVGLRDYDGHPLDAASRRAGKCVSHALAWRTYRPHSGG
jgi:hypothetical protein